MSVWLSFSPRSSNARQVQDVQVEAARRLESQRRTGLDPQKCPIRCRLLRRRRQFVRHSTLRRDEVKAHPPPISLMSSVVDNLIGRIQLVLLSHCFVNQVNLNASLSYCSVHSGCKYVTRLLSSRLKSCPIQSQEVSP